MKHRKGGNPDQPEVGKSEAKLKKQQTEIAASVLLRLLLDAERHPHLEYSTLQTSKL